MTRLLVDTWMTPLGWITYLDCMRTGEEEFDRMFFSKFFATKKDAQNHLKAIGKGMQDEFGVTEVPVT